VQRYIFFFNLQKKYFFYDVKFNFQTELHLDIRSIAALQKYNFTHTLYQITKLQLLSYIDLFFKIISHFISLFCLRNS